MTFPSDYKVVKLPGTTTGVLDVYNGFERQLIVDTNTWTLRLMDGTTPGGYPVVHLRDFATFFTDGGIVEQGTKLSVEVATNTGIDTDLIDASNKVRPWAPLVIRQLFEKLANTATAGTWRILDSALPEALQQAAAEVNDLNDAIYDGFYTVDPSSAANIPGSISTATTRNLAVMVTAQTTDNVMQMLVERDNSAKIWIRVRLDGVWQAWVLASGVTSGDLATKVSKSGDTMTGALDMGGFALSRVLSINGGPTTGYNYCINGNFNYWQRSSTQTTNGYNSADRWTVQSTGSTKVTSIQSSVLGDSSHGDPFFTRTVVTSVAGANNYTTMGQHIEDVLVFAGKRVTVTFEAKSNAVRDIAIEGNQLFGTGGSPSANVLGLSAQRVTLGTTWQKYSVVIDFPSVTGKTLGTNPDHSSLIWFWMDAGSSLNSRTANLGQQSGTFDFRHISFRIGDARSETDPLIPRPRQQEIALCQRYYEARSFYMASYMTAGQSISLPVSFLTQKRIDPALTASGPVYANGSGVVLSSGGKEGLIVTWVVTAAGRSTLNFGWTADAEF